MLFLQQLLFLLFFWQFQFSFLFLSHGRGRRKSNEDERFDVLSSLLFISLSLSNLFGGGVEELPFPVAKGGGKRPKWTEEEKSLGHGNQVAMFLESPLLHPLLLLYSCSITLSWNWDSAALDFNTQSQQHHACSYRKPNELFHCKGRTSNYDVFS